MHERGDPLLHLYSIFFPFHKSISIELTVLVLVLFVIKTLPLDITIIFKFQILFYLPSSKIIEQNFILKTLFPFEYALTYLVALTPVPSCT